MQRALLSGSILLGFALAAPPAALCAQPEPAAPQPEPAAQVLFDRGLADMEAGRHEKGCPAIEASQRLDPRPGTLFTLAECEAQRGRVATAMRYYAEYLALYRTFNDRKRIEQKERAGISEEQLRKLDLLVPRLTLKLPPQSGTDIVVRRDGDVVADLSLGTALTVDPGEHLVTTQTPGGPEVEHRISLAAGESKTLALTVRRVPAPPVTVPILDSSLLSTTATSTPPAPPDIRSWRIGTLSVGAAGFVGLVVGAVTGILAIEQRGIMNRNCELHGNTETCTNEGIEASRRLVTFGTASTVGFVVGGLGVAVGIALWVATPSVPTPPPAVGGGQASGAFAPRRDHFGVGVTGTF